MNDLKMEDLQEPVSTSETEETEEGTEPETVEQDPLKAELERVQSQKKEGRTEKEKAEYSLRKNAERVRELGGDPNSILGIEHETIEPEEDDKPVTLGMLKKFQQETASKNALQLAEEIPTETERELVKYHLQNTIRSTGNPQEDLKLARSIVNGVKNSQILEELARKTPPKTHSNATGAPAKEDNSGELTPEELQFTKPPFNLSKEKIIATRGK